MASGPLDGSREKHRWADSSKVYTRKSFNKTPKSQPPLSSSSQTLASSAAAAAAADVISLPPPPLVHASDDDSSNRYTNCQRHVVTISLASRSKQEVRDLRRKLTTELDQVRALVRKFEARENHQQVPANSQFSRQLSVSVPENSVGEKEKRMPKANQYYRNSDFVLGKEKFPPLDSHKKSKSNGSKMGMVDKKMYGQAFKSCASLLSKLMVHKHGWVFNTPVDVKALGLHDYHSIIKHPMDLGTVKSRLSKNWYKTPEEFAEDVRLTFRNAMTYNPKGQDVHIMAEQLLQLFQERWPVIEAEYTYLSSPRPPLVSAKRPPPPSPPIEPRKLLERSDLTVNPMSVDSKTKPVGHTPHVGRPPVLKKPKAKDLHKRDMTFDEKQKLSNNLQNLPPEKLDNIVQIIKKRNSTLSQHDDEIEVDIDSVDTETLWELDRFVTNYKKSLSKNKRKAEIALLLRPESHQHMVPEPVQERQNSNPVVVDVPKESGAVGDERNVASSSPRDGEKKGDNASRSSSSSTSSSDSGSSSSDSDSDSSSAGSDAGHSPRS